MHGANQTLHIRICHGEPGEIGRSRMPMTVYAKNSDAHGS
jgi:hypothetical protein